MKRKISQLRAIYYSYREKQLKLQREFLESNGLMDVFKKSKYKTMTNFIKGAKQ